MSCATARKLLQKRACLEGYTASKKYPADVKRSYGKAERRLLDLIREMGGRICRCLSLSQSCGRLHNSGTVGEWIGGIGCGLVEMLTWPTLSSDTIGLPCCLYRTAWSSCVCQNNRPYMCGGSCFIHSDAQDRKSITV